LLRCLKSKGAKSVYIPSNRNGNQRRTATITFATKEEMNSAQTKPIRYNNFRVYWVMEEKRETRKRESLKNRRKEKMDGSDQDADSEDSESVDSQKNKKYKNRRKDRKDINTENQTQMQDLLQRILIRLERLETQKGQSTTFVKRGWSQRS
jgi:Skp family chaperone for outer membrane proteins